MKDKTFLRIGVLGALITALCCFTPLLVVLLAAAGISAATYLDWLDYLLLPLLVFFVGLCLWAYIRLRRADAGQRKA
jgi:mercuric ion transport protein